MLPTIRENYFGPLHYYQTGEIPTQIFFIHGLLGNGKNWQTFMKILTNSKKISCCSLDLRGHGNSQHFASEKEECFQTMVKDVISAIDSMGDTAVYLVGHSLGGKVAISVANRMPQRIAKLMVEDIGLGPIPNNVVNVLSWLRAIPTPIESLELARQKLSQFSNDQRLCDFLLTNLVHKGEGMFWRVDIDGLQTLVNELAGLSLHTDWQGIQIPITLIRGANSDHLSFLHAQEMLEQKRPGQVQLVTLQRSGHWCHADEPQKFRTILEEFVAK